MVCLVLNLFYRMGHRVDTVILLSAFSSRIYCRHHHSPLLERLWTPVTEKVTLQMSYDFCFSLMIVLVSTLLLLMVICMVKMVVLCLVIL